LESALTVSRLAEVVSQRFFACRQTQVVAINGRLCRVEARLQGRASWTTERLAGESIMDVCPALGHLVKVGREIQIPAEPNVVAQTQGGSDSSADQDSD